MLRVRSDQELLDLWRGGDLIAGEELFDRYYDLVYRFFSSAVEADLAALVQETFTACLEGRQPVDPDRSFRVHLLAIAYRTLEAHLQEAARDGGRITGDETTETNLPATAKPVDIIESSTLEMPESDPAAPREPGDQRDQRRLQRALRRLPFIERALIALHDFGSLSEHDIAGIVGLPVTEVAPRLSRARALPGVASAAMFESAEAALAGFFASAFAADEMRRFIRSLPDGARLDAALPGAPASPGQLAPEVVRVLVRHDLVRAALFERLEAERPRRRDEIHRIRRLFEGAADTELHRPPP
jgi:RNA polymerase sigma-70 factor (ECF subfamily)